ncbi:MAG: WbqC family protein [bacterium]
MRIAILQPGYLPWFGFFDQELSVDRFVLYDDVQYDRRGWRNRNRLKSPTGPAWLTVPVIQKGKYLQKINEVEIDNDRPWKKKHLGAINSYYKKAPYFNELYPQFEKILSEDRKFLSDLALEIINWLNGIIGIDTPITLSSSLDVKGEGTDRLLDICLKLGASEYYSGAAARHYMELEKFRDAGIGVFFQEYEHPVYPQLHGEFVSHLSVLDLAMVALGEAKRIIESGRKWKSAF